MDARQTWTRVREDSATKEVAWLLGQPPLEGYLDYVRHKVLGGVGQRRSDLVDEWRAANDHYHELEVKEPGAAEGAEVRPLEGAMRPLARQLARDPRYRRTFDAVPTRLALVELDRLIVSQSHIDLGHAERLKARIGRSPTPEALFRFCQLLERSDPPVRMRRTGERRFTFWSESSDFRFHRPTLLGPEQITDYEGFGPLGAMVGLAVGFGSNFLSVVESERRLLLHNGHHRAYALRDLGVTHAPCIVQTVTRRDELDMVAPRSVVEAPAFYLKAARPPLLKDFFDPKIRKVLRVPTLLRVLEVSFELDEFEVAE